MATVFPKPGDEYCEPMDTDGRFLDRERFAIERFRYPSCERSLELFETGWTPEDQPQNPEAIALVAACRGCDIELIKAEWRKVIEHLPLIPVWLDSDLSARPDLPDIDGKDIPY